MLPYVVKTPCYAFISYLLCTVWKSLSYQSLLFIQHLFTIQFRFYSTFTVWKSLSYTLLQLRQGEGWGGLDGVWPPASTRPATWPLASLRPDVRGTVGPGCGAARPAGTVAWTRSSDLAAM
jgi:hypothetical protein